MQKISGILPNSPRVSAVDMKESQPVRPGAPGFGRPEGVSSLKERASAVDAMRRSQQLTDDIFNQRSKEGEQVDIVRQISDGFFGRKTVDVAGAVVAKPMEGAVMVASMEPSSSVAESGYKYDRVTEALRETAPEPDGLYPKGSFIDVVA